MKVVIKDSSMDVAQWAANHIVEAIRRIKEALAKLA